MSRSIVSLQPSGAFIDFSVNLGSVYMFRLDWNSLLEYFFITIRDSKGARIVAGRGLHVGVNIMDGIKGFNGTLILEGEKPTPENLGVTNKLVWER